MRDTALHIVVVEEGVDIEVVLLASHVGQRRGMKRVLGTAPDEEIAVVIGHIIEVEARVHVLVLRHRYMVGHVASQPCAVVEALLTVALVLESADRSRHIEVAYPARVRSLGTVVDRQTGTRMVILRVVIVDAHIAGHLGSRRQARTLGAHIDHAVERRRAVQHRRSAFDHLDLRHILQRYVVPVDLSRLGVQNSHLVHQYLAARTDAVGPTATASYAGLLVDDLHAGHGLQGSGEVRRRLGTDGLRLEHLHADRHIRHALLEPSGSHHHLLQHLVVRLQHQVVIGRKALEHALLGLIAHIRELQMYGQRADIQLVVPVQVRHGAGTVIRIQDGDADQRLASEGIGNDTTQFFGTQSARKKNQTD